MRSVDSKLSVIYFVISGGKPIAIIFDPFIVRALKADGYEVDPRNFPVVRMERAVFNRDSLIGADDGKFDLKRALESIRLFKKDDEGNFLIENARYVVMDEDGNEELDTFATYDAFGMDMWNSGTTNREVIKYIG